MPPSVNSYYRSVGRGKVLISESGRKYRKEVKDQILIQRVRFIEGRLQLEVKLHFATKGKNDLDNRCKSLLDALQHAGVYEDDSQIDVLIVRRGPVTKGGLCEVDLQTIG